MSDWVSGEIASTSWEEMLNRRQFTKSLIATGTALGAGASSLNLAKAQPKRGGRLCVAGVQSAQDTLDPAIFVQSTDYARGSVPQLEAGWLEAAAGRRERLLASPGGVTLAD
ncbi:hypothetical protein [Mesorhizobium sp. M0296]|uniref:hypothetical protein n=1 Tax=Mesorhizobium sp. M0296 TaxID=2956931 RepID=UPI00333889EA